MKELDLWNIVDEFSSGYRKSAVLFAAIDLNLFEVIFKKAQSSQELAASYSFNSNRIKSLLDVLVVYGFLERNKGVYSIKDQFKALVDPEREDNLSARYAHSAKLYKSWFKLADVLREDKPARELLGKDRKSEEDIIAFHKSLGTRSMNIAESLIKDIKLPKAAKLLDLGGGFGDFCRPFLAEDVDAKATLFDTEATTSLAITHHKDLGLDNRFKVISGDFLAGPIPSGFDFIVVSSILHIYDESTCIELLEKLKASANHNAMLLIKEISIDDDYLSPQSGTEFSLNMAINTEKGDAYPLSVVCKWLTISGWNDVRQLNTNNGIYILTAKNSS